MYQYARKILFKFDPEMAHAIALKSLNFAYKLGLLPLFSSKKSSPRTLMGITFPNPVGLAAGLDKDADYVDALAELGFGFIEIGTVTPKPQAGNPKPRLFRLAKQEAIINRMGFNGKGMAYVKSRLEKIKFKGVLGINIGKNRDTPNEQALDDYLLCFRELWPYASYITINISSPNTPGLRNLQHTTALRELLTGLKQAQQEIQQQKYVPLVVKISPDVTDSELSDIAAVLVETKIDGVIATNTTLSREGVEESSFADEQGGLSGAPLMARNTKIIQQLHQQLQNKIPIIACGGIMHQSDVQEKLRAGASLVQVYSGFIYKGTAIIAF